MWAKVYKQLDDGLPVRTLDFNIDEAPIVAELPLITAKPLIFACNVDTHSYMEEGMNPLAEKLYNHIQTNYPGIPFIQLSSLLEEELVQIR